MEKLVDQVTEHILEKLPKGKDYYTPEDLRSNGVYEFVVKRVEIEMNKKLRESLVPPDSDWAEMKTDQVMDHWEQFIEAIVEEMRMPASEAKSVFETAVSDILDLLTRPRTTIPMLLFMDDDELDKKTLKKRSEMVTVNTHLVDTLNRYMEKKRKNKIVRLECETVIERIDQRLVSNYNALNWAQLLEPLFKLFDSSVDTNLFRIFYEEKGMLRVSRKFDMMNTSLTKTEFIEVLSAPYLLNLDDEEDSVSLFDAPASQMPSKKSVVETEDKPKFTPGFEPETDSEPQGKSEGKPEVKSEDKPNDRAEKKDTVNTTDTDTYKSDFEKPAELPDLGNIKIPEPPTFSEANEETKNQAQGPVKSDIDSDEIEDSIIANFHKRRKFITPEEEADEEDSTLHSKFMLDTGQEIDEDEDEGKKKVKFGDLSESLLKEQEIPDGEDEDFTFIIDEDSDKDSDEDSPMWKAFLEQQKEFFAEQESALNKDEDNEIATESDSETRSITKEKLETWLEDEKSKLIEVIFNGSESKYEKALDGLAGCKNWVSASKYIEKEIFTRNSIDMYDEIAVDFTDRLHTYFKEFK